jgi:hypothetical protein
VPKRPCERALREVGLNAEGLLLWVRCPPSGRGGRELRAQVKGLAHGHCLVNKRQTLYTWQSHGALALSFSLDVTQQVIRVYASIEKLLHTSRFLWSQETQQPTNAYHLIIIEGLTSDAKAVGS